MSRSDTPRPPVKLPVLPERPPSPGARNRPFSEADVPAELLPLWRALREVMDPELPVSVVDLGLIHAIRRDGPRVEVELTFTAIGCPCMDFISMDIRERLLREPGVEEVALEIVWDPPWSRLRMTEEARRTLRGLGVAA